ncbi:YbaB/EbfC family nucleoid-associated protein [Saccharopolyspora sp. 5N708]|uniref:YbaB/EbfC family nucleoid-associated protein n=1 Tax=Saccharopolyspora sp. 5N708 TaxID=3457424 RepID=UPI003FD5329C
MTWRDDSSAAREDLGARNAALRNQIDDMLSDLRRRTAEIQEKQAEAARQTYEVASEDGTVTVRVDATGTVQEVALSPKAFERSTPEKLAASITSVIREASGTAQRTLRDQFAPMTDTTNVPEIPGIPSLQGLISSGPLVEPPDPEAERAQRRSADTAGPTGARQPEVRSRPAPEDDWDDWNWDDSNRRGGRR